MKLDVRVLTDGVYVNDALARPRRRTPIGYTGIVFKGHVFPVNVDAAGVLFIEMQNEFFSKAECDLLSSSEVSKFLDETEVEGSSEIKFYIESNFYGHYLVFDADEPLYNDIIKRLKTEGFSVVTKGASYRPADNGYQYDWYIRLDKDLDYEELNLKIERLFSGLSQTISGLEAESITDGFGRYEDKTNTKYTVEEIWSTLENTVKVLTETKKEAIDLNEKLEIFQDDLANARTEVGELKGQLAVRSGELAKNERSYHRKISQLSRKLQLSEASQGLGSQDADVSLRNENVELQNLLDLALVEIEEINEQNDLREYKLFNEITDLKHSRVELNDRVQELSRHSVKTGAEGHSKRVKTLFYQMGTAILEQFENLVFSNDSLEIILNEFNSLKSLLKTLERLNLGEIRAISIRGSKNLFEVPDHIHTGRPEAADMGRVYWKKTNEGKKLVFCHVKKDDKEQEIFLRSIQ